MDGMRLPSVPTASTHLAQIEQVESFHWRVADNDIPAAPPCPLAGSDLTLSAAVELLCIEHHLRQSPESRVPTNLGDCPLWKALKRLHWPSSDAPLSFRADALEIMILPMNSADWRWSVFLHNLQRALKEHGFPGRLSGFLTGAMGEVVDNVWEHSETSLPGIAGYEVARRRLDFAVADLGVGVLASLRKNPSFRFLDSSMEALQRAILNGVSRFPDQSRGYGFSRLLQTVAELWGFARLRSGQAALMFDHRTDARRRTHKYLPNLPGLQISVSCGLSRTGPSRAEIFP
jgi:hypothetical protein